MWKVLTAVIIAATILPVSVQAQGRQGGPMGAARMNPVAQILEQRDALRLTAEQVSGLEAIRASLDEKNAPLLARLPDGQRSGGNPQAMMQQMRPVLEELRGNNNAAVEQAMALLTPEQRESARAALPEQGRPGGGPRRR